MDKLLKIRIVDIDSVPKDLLNRRWPNSKGIDPELEKYVKLIIEEVKTRGDSALRKFTKKFDGVDLDAEALRVTQKEIDAAYDNVDEKHISALKFLKSQIEHFEVQRLERINYEFERSGIRIYSKTYPLESVGCYVPGGEAAYPSTLIMTAAPAKLACVKRIVVCSPPTKNGVLNPLTLIAANLCEVDEVYKVGGAQAIAALAYGTDSIKPVKKIVGPGNRYVTAAKILVSQDIAIDFPAGPTEIFILADEDADPRLIALDLASQAEHGVGSASILATTSEEIAKKVAVEAEEILSLSPRRKMIAQALSENGLIIKCKDLYEAIDFINKFAPEHLEIMTKDPMLVADKIKSAGMILIGPYAPVSASDYAFGTNHVLPTGGFAHLFSGLSVFDFMRRVNIVESSKRGLFWIRDHVKTLAEAEGLVNHALAVERRLEDWKEKVETG